MKILEFDQIEGWWWLPSWKEQKEELTKKYEKKYPEYKIKIKRHRSDTPRLRYFIVYGIEKEAK